MKVKELKKLLEGVDDERIVIMQKDGEGNGYSPLDNIDSNSVYIPDSSWSGEVKYEKLTPTLESFGYTEEDCDDGTGEPAVVLTPIN